MGRPLTAKQVEDLRPRIEAHVEQALDGLAAQPSGLVDLKEFFAYPLCLRILAERPSLPNLTAVSPLVPVSSTDGQPEAATAADADATSRLIVNAVRGLLRFPYQLELLTTGRYSWASAVKETLRWDPPVAHVLRYATEHLELEGALIRKGDPVLICLAAIGRDEAHFDAERFEITRSPNPNLGFGHGTHGCPGAPIALLIATVVLPALFTRFPRLARAPRAQGLPSMTVDTPQPCLVVVNAHLRDSLDEEIERLLRDV
ncbi:cytochrome P450 [Kitasatospora sp. GP82]|uniref:cytochrome P450 n=1 Tax=Kitasatospora sp. GP82 TaxID=3035089 RepID=UPI002473AB4E|nr:cytochrome P450 [Kitasatospora sp. GP82]